MEDIVVRSRAHLASLLHAHKCTNLIGCLDSPYCGTMKSVLAHIALCSLGRECTFPHCVSTRKLIGHWRTCMQLDCPICAPIRITNDQPNLTIVSPVANLFLSNISIQTPVTRVTQSIWQQQATSQPADNEIEELYQELRRVQELLPKPVDNRTDREEVRKLIRQRLVLFMHARKCSVTDATCSVPHCDLMKSLIEHIYTCPDGLECKRAHCASTRTCVRHWKYCFDDACRVCAPLREAKK